MQIGLQRILRTANHGVGGHGSDSYAQLASAHRSSGRLVGVEIFFSHRPHRNFQGLVGQTVAPCPHRIVGLMAAADLDVRGAADVGRSSRKEVMFGGQVLEEMQDFEVIWK